MLTEAETQEIVLKVTNFASNVKSLLTKEDEKNSVFFYDRRHEWGAREGNRISLGRRQKWSIARIADYIR